MNKITNTKTVKKIVLNNILKISFSVTILSITAGCANTSLFDSKTTAGNSYLNTNETSNKQSNQDAVVSTANNNETNNKLFQKVRPLKREGFSSSNQLLGAEFSDTDNFQVTVNNMSVKSFVNYVFVDLLSANFILGKEVDGAKITLNVINNISSSKLFKLAVKVLQDRGIGFKHENGVYYIYKLPKNVKSAVVIGFGRDESNVPENPGQILQVVPLKFGVRLSVERTVRGLVDAKITTDFEQGALFIQGRREQIIRAMDLIKLLDVPANRGKHIALISPVYISTDNFISSITKLLQTEGVDVGRTPQKTENLVFVPLTSLGSIVVFSSEKELIERVNYWSEIIDKPSKGTDRQYHVFTPRFARATDLGESIAPLIGNGKGFSDAFSDASGAVSMKEQKTSSQIVKNKTNDSISNENMTLVVDKRSNTLIFYASGTEYQSILPLVRRLDILPKQVLLSVTIAEVTLTDIFKRGFEFAVTSGNFSASTKEGIGISEILGFNLNWQSGANEIMSRFIEENSYVNVLSKPSILVRDGTEANIKVGNRVPVSSGTTSGSSGNVITSNVTYTETGINLTVTPTVNAQGVIIMEIKQEITNEVGKLGVGNNPIFFQRQLNTEVVADSGQTILLGGLISENVNNNDKGVPYLKSIPLLGSLFESEEKNNIKTELVIMVTPKVIERSNQWQGILNRFQTVLKNIDITD